MERTLLFGEKGRIRGKGDRDAGFLRRVTAWGKAGRTRRSVRADREPREKNSGRRTVIPSFLPS